MLSDDQDPTPKYLFVPGLRRIGERVFEHRKLLLFVSAPVFLLLLALGALYHRATTDMDERLRGGPFRDSVNIYAAEMVLNNGDALSAEELGVELSRTGYKRSDSGAPGTYGETAQVVTTNLRGSGSGQARVQISDKNQISRIELSGKEVKTWTVGYPLITNLSSGTEKRHLMDFKDIPPVLVHAVVSAEDKHFFQHNGLDLPRIVKAAYVDLHEGRKEQGASTLTMQLVRGLWLQPEKLWSRKFTEMMMTVHLEQKWSKEEIFQTYANQVFLGRQAAYSIQGFAQGAEVFFGKDLRDISLAEAALLAGMVQRPSYFNPYRNPERAKERRNLVLSLMHANGFITEAQYRDSSATKLALAGAQQQDDAFGAPYFLDRVNDELRKNNVPEDGVKNVYTTIDLNLQRAAREAVKTGMSEVDALLARRRGNIGGHAEAALIAVDPRTGEVKAMVGGRDYGQSQFNRILSKRPPGSVFKPFVYAAALNTAVEGGEEVYTPASIVDDSPVSFNVDGKDYQPSNYHHEEAGTLTFRQALAKSNNVAAVKVAQKVGYREVVAMARRSGLNDEIGATPSVALGSYVVTPLEMAGAYTTFANGGKWTKPSIISSVRNLNGDTVMQPNRESRQALDPRVAYLMVSMLEEVMRSGTAAGVRSRGFLLPAAGKTGTSHDGWFAGFTSELICLVWVGFDDYRELNLEGAKSALPIWTEFMKKASKIGAYRNAKPFAVPVGITSAQICMETGKLAGDLCDTRREFFVAGSEPKETCELHELPRTFQAPMLYESGRPPVVSSQP